jgi:hypothetical protein
MPDRPSWPNWSSIGWVSTCILLSGSSEVRGYWSGGSAVIGGRPLRSLAIELVVEDGAHRAIGQGADLDRPRGGAFEAIGTEWPRQADDAEASAEALFGMRPALQD